MSRLTSSLTPNSHFLFELAMLIHRPSLPLARQPVMRFFISFSTACNYFDSAYNWHLIKQNKMTIIFVIIKRLISAKQFNFVLRLRLLLFLLLFLLLWLQLGSGRRAHKRSHMEREIVFLAWTHTVQLNLKFISARNRSQVHDFFACAHLLACPPASLHVCLLHLEVNIS